jgi:hypothetical protein
MTQEMQRSGEHPIVDRNMEYNDDEHKRTPAHSLEYDLRINPALSFLIYGAIHLPNTYSVQHTSIHPNPRSIRMQGAQASPRTHMHLTLLRYILGNRHRYN